MSEVNVNRQWTLYPKRQKNLDLSRTVLCNHTPKSGISGNKSTEPVLVGWQNNSFCSYYSTHLNTHLCPPLPTGSLGFAPMDNKKSSFPSQSGSSLSTSGNTQKSAANPPQSSSLPPAKRSRKAINCQPCRSSKLKCDRFLLFFRNDFLIILSFYLLFTLIY